MKRVFKLGLVAAAAMATVVPLLAQPAYADYAPGPSDVVGVGSDTLQYMLDFLANGDAYGNPGYNQQNFQNKLVSIDATADYNARLAYGNFGGVLPSGDTSGNAPCAPGTGSEAGTGNQTAANTGGFPCTLNPTVVLRAGKLAVQRPNGSTAGFNALVQDIEAGHNTFGLNEQISFARASSAKALPGSGIAAGSIDQITIATDPLPILTSSATQPAGTDGKTTDYALSATQLSTIYGTNANGGNTGSGQLAGTGCITWNDPRISGTVDNTVAFSTGDTSLTIPTGQPVPPASAVNADVDGTGITAGTTVTGISGRVVSLSAATTGSSTGETVMFANSQASADMIIPIIPQVGSGTRSYFEGQLNPTLSDNTLGNCTIVGEENDPTAIRQASHPADAIEPMSLGRLFVYQGEQNSAGGPVAGGLHTINGGYFLDPSCPYENPAGASNTGNSQTATCGTGSVTGGTYEAESMSVSDVNALTSGTPVGSGASGTGSGLFDPSRNLFIYVRSADLDSNGHWQPTETDNFVQELFFSLNPNVTPYVSTPEGQQLLFDAGVVPLATPTCLIVTTTAQSSGGTACT